MELTTEQKAALIENLELNTDPTDTYQLGVRDTLQLLGYSLDGLPLEEGLEDESL